MHIFELKFILSLLLTPLVYPMTDLFYSDSSFLKSRKAVVEREIIIDEDSEDIFEQKVTQNAARYQHIPEKTKVQLQFFVLCFIVLVQSPFAKYFREEVCMNFETDRIMMKVK
mmetsp:Transcript_12946/g.21906  ORF Transcript_12946/g.21906 Transcript_12946/m.21906 type:complete len:113 (+) Transcript_12946:247-585(+)